MLRIISANLNGIRAAQRKGFFDWMPNQYADIVCIQELKAQKGDLTHTAFSPEGYYRYSHYAEKKGYSGVAIYSKQPAERLQIGLGVALFDQEGRYLEADIGKLTIISLYLPSGSSGEERQQFKYRFMDHFFNHLQALFSRGRDVVICGDWNIAHQAIDLKNWKSNQKNSGFLPEERQWFSRILEEVGWVDTYRKLYPDTTAECYTWWSNRGQAWANNVGWRLDYQLSTPAIAATARQANIYKDSRFSDHAPLTIDYDFEL